MKYQDFAITIEPKQGDAYPVSVASPAGEGHSALILPFAPDEVGAILTDLGHGVRGSGAAPLRDLEPVPAAPRASAEEVGDRLFAALFSGPVRSLFDESRGLMRGTDSGLRIKIRTDPEDPSLAQLTSLPWEFLYRRETRDWLNLSRYTPVVRYLDVQRPHTPLALRPPLRILVVMAQPAGSRPLDLAKERTLIEGNWARLQSVEVDFLEAATAETLGDRLTEKPYHVIHYMGHGDFDERTGRGVLLLEDEDRQSRPIDGPTLGILLRDVPSLRLVVLNACETARLTKETGLDPFAGVASSLVMAGVPAVVAMQFPISDDAAITFAKRFYTLLARGEAVDTGVAEGRRAIRTSQPDTLEWGTPVLFMRAADGVIFRVTGVAAATASAPEAGPEPASGGEETPPIEGSYTAIGKNADGSAYSGTVTITRVGDHFEIVWFIGGDRIESFGYQEGRTLQCDEWSVVYEIKEDGTLDGKWGNAGTEKLIPKSISGRPGDRRPPARTVGGSRVPPTEAPPPAGSESPPSIAVTRELLESAFTPETLRRFCEDRALFRPIVARFGSNQGLDDMVDRVIEYCEKQVLLNELLAEVEKENPRQFARFKSRLWSGE